jgi:hypothetical protein
VQAIRVIDVRGLFSATAMALRLPRDPLRGWKLTLKVSSTGIGRRSMKHSQHHSQLSIPVRKEDVYEEAMRLASRKMPKLETLIQWRSRK